METAAEITTMFSGKPLENKDNKERTHTCTITARALGGRTGQKACIYYKA
jgi:hypothetical protein